MTDRAMFGLIRRTALVLVVIAVLYWVGQYAGPDVGRRPVAEPSAGTAELPRAKSRPLPTNRSVEISGDGESGADQRLGKTHYEAASPHLPPLPPGSRIVDIKTERQDGLLETVVKLESNLSPLELQLFYTDRLVQDWIIFRDSLTETVGWSGVFMQIGEAERRLGIFAVVEQWGPNGVDSVSTKISLLLAEEP